MEIRFWVNRMYGTSAKAVYTLFEVTLSGCWPTYARPLIEEVSWLYAIFFILYVACPSASILAILARKGRVNILGKSVDELIYGHIPRLHRGTRDMLHRGSSRGSWRPNGARDAMRIFLE